MPVNQTSSLLIVTPMYISPILYIIYVVIFIVGFFGNLKSAFMMTDILRQIGLSKLRHANLVVCTLILNLIDLLTCLSIPFLLVNYIFNSWPFNRLVCKLFWSWENSWKIGSKFIIVIMSLERLTSIANIGRNFFGNLKILIISLLIAFVTSLVISTPYYVYSGCIEMNETLGFNSSNFTQVTKCLIDMPENETIIFTWALFTITYCFPTIVIVGCYIGILGKIFWHKRTSGRSLNRRVSFKRVLRNCILSVLLYLSCWSPYWIATIQMIMGQRVFGWKDYEAQYRVLTYVVHPAVYLNAAVDWIPYVLLNSDLR